MQASNRAQEWNVFATQVENHIEQYTVPRYGDSPDDYVSKQSVEWCVQQMGKYAARFNAPERFPGERMQDMLKAAHFACIAWAKMEEADRGALHA